MTCFNDDHHQLLFASRGVSDDVLQDMNGTITGDHEPAPRRLSCQLGLIRHFAPPPPTENTKRSLLMMFRRIAKFRPHHVRPFISPTHQTARRGFTFRPLPYVFPVSSAVVSLFTFRPLPHDQSTAPSHARSHGGQ